MPELIPPFLVYFAGALLLPLLPKSLRPWVFLAPPVIVLWLLSGFQDGQGVTVSFLHWELEPLRIDRLSLLFGWIFAIVTLVAGIYALHVKDAVQQVGALFYSGAALGAVFSGDLFTLFVFWEIMAVGSACLIWARRSAASHAAGMRYIYVHLFGGALLLGGILLHLGETGSLAFQAFEGGGLATWMILLGFAVNAAIPPLHAWLPDAYPAATVTGAVFLSAFTTKTAVYTLARGFPESEVLMWAGVIMALYGVTYAILAEDIRRLLAYHIVSQVGFMVAGIGLGSEMAINGATAHAFTHILYKGLLFMATGAVLYATGTSRQVDLGGLARYMPWTLAFYMVAAFSISGVPLFSGFVSKSITVDAASAMGEYAVYLLLYLASIGTFLSIALKLPYFTWWAESKSYPDLKPLPRNMVIAMAIGAGLNIFLGLYPQPLYGILPFALDYQAYTATKVLNTVQLLGFTFLGFWMIRKKLFGKPYIALDTDWVYRRPAKASYIVGPKSVAVAFGAIERTIYDFVESVVRLGRDPVNSFLRGRRPGRVVTAEGETASTTLRITTTFGVILVLVSTFVVFVLLLF